MDEGGDAAGGEGETAEFLEGEPDEGVRDVVGDVAVGQGAVGWSSKKD